MLLWGISNNKLLKNENLINAVNSTPYQLSNYYQLKSDFCLTKLEIYSSSPPLFKCLTHI